MTYTAGLALLDFVAYEMHFILTIIGRMDLRSMRKLTVGYFSNNDLPELQSSRIF